MSDFYVNKFGRAGDVDAAMDVYDVSTGSYEFPTVAFQTEVVGGLTDMVNSTGIHTVKVYGLNAAGQEVTEVATLDAVTPVVLANSYYRVNRMHTMVNSAPAGLNSYHIICRHTGSATLARITAQEGQTLQAIYTMPAGVSGNIVAWRADAAREASQVDFVASLRLQTRDNGEGWRTRDTAISGNMNSLNRVFQTPKTITIKPMTDIRIRVTAVNTDNGTVGAGFEIKGFRNVR